MGLVITLFTSYVDQDNQIDLDPTTLNHKIYLRGKYDGNNN
jgi:hypothetical protein